MPFTIQRVPRGLSEVLAIFGGEGPKHLEERIQASLESLQFYGLAQLQTPLTLNAALASGGTVDVQVPDGQWWVLFLASASVTEQAALTSLQLTLGITYPGPSANQTLAWLEKKAGFIATDETIVTHVSPFPRVIPPGTRVRARARFAGVANVAIGVTATVGVLG